MNRIKETNRLLAENLVRSIMKDYEACGIAAAIIDKNGVTQYEKFWGVRDLESQKELDGETIFGLASVTKSFTNWPVFTPVSSAKTASIVSGSQISPPLAHKKG